MFNSNRSNGKTTSPMDISNYKNNGDSQKSLNKISEETVIEGKVISKGDFRIDGTINGMISTQGRIVVGEAGLVSGEIKCTNAEIDGKINGTITVEETLIIHATGLVEGDINVGSLITEKGASLNLTSCKMIKADGGKEKDSAKSVKSAPDAPDPAAK